MAEEIKIDRWDSTLEMVLLDSIAKHLGTPEFERFKGSPRVLSVQLTINGVECQFSHVVDRIMKWLDHRAERKATEMIRERSKPLDDIAAKLWAMEDLTRSMQKEFGRLAVGVFPECESSLSRDE